MSSTSFSGKNIIMVLVTLALVLVFFVPTAAICQEEETTVPTKSDPIPKLSQLDMDRIEYNKLKYEEFELKRKGGAGLITVSAVLFIPASLLFFAIYGSGYAPVGFLLIGAAAGIGGIAAIIGGASMIRNGKEGMRRAKNNEFYPVPEQPEAQFSMERKKRAFAKAPGLSLSFVF